MVAHTNISNQVEGHKNSSCHNGSNYQYQSGSANSCNCMEEEKHTPDSNLNAKLSWRKIPPSPAQLRKTAHEDCNLLVAFFTFLSFGVILLVGYVKEFFFPPSTEEKNRETYVPLYIGFESFYSRNVYRRIKDCFDRPITGVPGAYVHVFDRESPDYGHTMNLTGSSTKYVNVGSYNYLGFAENKGACHSAAKEVTKKLGISTCSSRLELGTMKIHNELEKLIAEYLGVEDAITFGMGFATNTLNIPSIVGPGCLVLSDECNHASLILGLRLSQATCKVFRHNNPEDLEKKLRYHIIHGQPRTCRPWRKILIVAEGIYSVEGTICNLPRLIELKKKYKAYLYLDEAHSIGALGPNGGGVADYFGCDPRDIDVLMGTFTKSFASAGGYIAGRKELIDNIRVSSDAQCYAAAMSPPVAQQIISSLTIIMGKDGTDNGQRRIQQLARNVVYFRKRLQQMGFIIAGDEHSPVVPLMFFMIPKIASFVRELSKRGVAGVGVGFPATKITGGRMRFCLSASHSKEILDEILEKIREVGLLCSCKHSYETPSKEIVEW